MRTPVKPPATRSAPPPPAAAVAPAAPRCIVPRAPSPEASAALQAARADLAATKSRTAEVESLGRHLRAFARELRDLRATDHVAEQLRQVVIDGWARRDEQDQGQGGRERDDG